MPHRGCDFASCANPADRCIGSCFLCAKHLCAHHFRAESHTCPCREDDPGVYYSAYAAARKRYLEALLAKINVEALRLAASRVRGENISCRIPALEDYVNDPAGRLSVVSSQCGGQNCHVDIEFADGVVWIARIPLDHPRLPPPEIQARIFLSEVATLKFLARTKVPAPHVHASALESPENAVGTSYVLMEKLAGKALDWNGANAKQRLRVMEQLADVYLELERHPLALSGSMSLRAAVGKAEMDGDQIEIRSFALASCFETPKQGLGPFRSLDAAYTAIIRQQMQTIVNHEVSGLPLDNYLTYLWRLKALPTLIANSASREGPFYLKHNDDKGDHILVDEKHNITGIIDWEFASTESKELAFSSPCMMWPVRKFYEGNNDLAEDELRFANIFDARGRADIGNLVRGGRQWQRFFFSIGGGVLEDREALFLGLRKSCDYEVGDVLPHGDWKARFLCGDVKNDTQVKALMHSEQEVEKLLSE